MFRDLQNRLTDLFKHLKNKGALRAEDITQAMRDIRVALLEADVSLQVIRPLIEAIKEKSLGKEVADSLTPGQVVLKIVHDHLVDLLSYGNEQGLNFKVTPPAVMMLVGLQGSGKTTSAGKIAYWLQKQGKKVLLTSTDVYRPAARQQLAQLAEKSSIAITDSTHSDDPLTIATAALKEAKRDNYDVLIVDTAGRLNIDAPLMRELEALKKALAPKEILFVGDAMMGQEAAAIAKDFHDALALTGHILTRTEGDAKGGAALSIGAITERPLKFVGTGERTEDLEPFDPKRQVGRILDQGDVVALVEEVQAQVADADVERTMKRMQAGIFTLDDLAKQLTQMQRMGNMSKFLGLLPGMGSLMKQLPKNMDQEAKKNAAQQLAIIRSMTPKERKYPTLLGASRKRRVAAGSGTQVQDINRLLKQYEQMGKMMKRLRKISKKGGSVPPDMGAMLR